MSIPPLSTVPPRARSFAPAVSAPRRKGGKRPPRLIAAPYLFLLPYFILTAVFFIYPLLHATTLAFYETNGAQSRLWVGWANFKFILTDPDFYKALENTSIFAACSLLIQLPLSLGLALLLNSKNDRLKGFFRLAIFAPNLVGQVFVGIMFSLFFAPRYGLFNIFLDKLVHWGFDKHWLDDPALVMPAIVIAALWIYVGFNMVYFLAALQNVDQSLVEAAKIDGASPLGIFRHVTIPAIIPVGTFVVVTSTIGSFQLFELPYILLCQNGGTGYGPNNSGMTIVSYLYRYAFENNDLGTAAAVGWLLTLIVLGLSLIQIRASGTVRRDA